MRSRSLLWWGFTALGAGVLLTGLFAVATVAGLRSDNPLLLTGPLLLVVGPVLLVVGAVMRAVRR